MEGKKMTHTEEVAGGGSMWDKNTLDWGVSHFIWTPKDLCFSVGGQSDAERPEWLMMLMKVLITEVATWINIQLSPAPRTTHSPRFSLHKSVKEAR